MLVCVSVTITICNKYYSNDVSDYEIRITQRGERHIYGQIEVDRERQKDVEKDGEI